MLIVKTLQVKFINLKFMILFIFIYDIKKNNNNKIIELFIF